MEQLTYHLAQLLKSYSYELFRWLCSHKRNNEHASKDCKTLIQDTKNLIAGASAILRIQWNRRRISESVVNVCFYC